MRPAYTPSTDPCPVRFDALVVFEAIAEIAIEAGAHQNALTALLQRIEDMKAA